MELTVLNRQEHESKCRRCGITCHLPVRVGDILYVVEELHCRFLERESGGRYHCNVYENRFAMAPWCHSAAEALAAGHVAHDCPYAADVAGHQGRQWAPPAVHDKLVPTLRQAILADGLPISCSPDAALRLLNRPGEHWNYFEQKDRFVFYSAGSHA